MNFGADQMKELIAPSIKEDADLRRFGSKTTKNEEFLVHLIFVSS
jgi:hypothetical protein